MIFEQIRVGGDRNFAYLVGDEESGKAAVVDPSYNPDLVMERAGANGLEIAYIINTHGHGDHTNGNGAIKNATGAKLVNHQNCRAVADLKVKHGDVLSVGGLELKFIHTPGHTDDAVSILADNKLITGDTLFVGKVGGTDFDEGARKQYNSIHERILSLSDDVEIWPGHDYGTAPSSTVGREKETNPFILRETFEEFVDLKKNWAEYKKEHGIA